jgi:pyruvate dehydrogenase E2 component (dihydrolipoamide acetyltransferase)
MSREFIFPDLGEGIAEGELVKWLVKEGDSVQEDQDVAEVETDKALVNIPSPMAGVVEKLHHREGDTVKVGSILMTFKESKEDQPKEKEAGEKKTEVKKQDKTEAPRSKAAGYSAKENKAEEASPAKAVPIESSKKSQLPPLAAPHTRKAARDLGVDLNNVKGSGPGGRITEADVRAAAESGSRRTGAAETAPISFPSPQGKAPAAGASEAYGPTVKVPLKGVRKKISDHMLAAAQQSVMVTHMDEADVGALTKIRKEKAEYAEKRGVKLTLLPFLMKACVIALKDHPYLNASLIGDEILLKNYYHFGFAVDTEAGLMVPVIRDVDKKSIMHLASELVDLSAKARERKIAIEELQGSSFSITNIGSIGGRAFTPILNYPDSAILGLGRTYEKPVVAGDKIIPATVLPLCLTFDHRITDGATAARFTNQVIQYLKDPDLLLLDDGED